MNPRFGAVVDRINDASRNEAEHAANIHDHSTFLFLEMRQEPDNHMHRSPDVNVNLLICFVQREVIDVEGPLYASIIDYAVEFGVLGGKLPDEGRNGGDVAGV